MSNKEQSEALVEEIQRVINRFRSEFEIDCATAIGCLEIVKLDLFREAMEDEG